MALTWLYCPVCPSPTYKNAPSRPRDEERARGATLVCRSLTAPASTVYADLAR